MVRSAADLLCPFDLGLDTVTSFLNAEFVDHPVYDGFELQWFDDDVHGTGLLAFLSRRADRRVDYYAQPGLQLDRSGYAIGGGTGRWVTADFEVARLEVGEHGVVADVAFTDVDGRRIEVGVDDRGGGPRRRAELLAPVGAGIEHPQALMLVYLHGFDLLHRRGTPPTIRIDGELVATGSLPGARLHRRHLVKAAAPLTVAKLCQTATGRLLPVDPDAPDQVVIDPSGTAIAGLAVQHGAARARFDLDPPLPPLATLEPERPLDGRWRIAIDGAPVTGGTWQVLRQGDRVDLGLEVTEPWRPPPGQPLLIRLVTRALPVFRQWPTTYRWRAVIDLDADPATLTAGWERASSDRGETYQRATSRPPARSSS